jgi:DNA-binding MarR family transcriptional regulator
MDERKFARITESLRQHQRADLREFEPEIGKRPIDRTYVDPLAGDAVLQHVLSSNTTFLLGRRGSGKSTVFARAQSEILARGQNIAIHVDVKSLYDALLSRDTNDFEVLDATIRTDVLQEHRRRKALLGAVLAEILAGIGESFERLSLYDRWSGIRSEYDDVRRELDRLRTDVCMGVPTDEELRILRMISTFPEQAVRTGDSALADILDGSDLYRVYSDTLRASFPFAEIIIEIQEMLRESGLGRLIIFLDDVCEVSRLDHRILIDVILAPLANDSSGAINLKMAAYPGHVYHGKLDAATVDTISLEFQHLYRDANGGSAPAAAIDFTTRLLTRRFAEFGTSIEDYLASSFPPSEFMSLMFDITFNVPRVIGHVLHHCYVDRVSVGYPITVGALRVAAQKTYEDLLESYFSRPDRFARELRERKTARRREYELLRAIIDEAKTARLRIVSGVAGGEELKLPRHPPASHFTVELDPGKLLSGLEMNFFVSKFQTLTKSDGREVTIYALNYGLTEAEGLGWRCAPARTSQIDDALESCFAFGAAHQRFVAARQVIRCTECRAAFDRSEQMNLARYGWLCPECRVGTCEVLDLDQTMYSDPSGEDRALMLEPVELEILGVLEEARSPMHAKEIAARIDVRYQLVGRCTSRLQSAGLVRKEAVDGSMRSSITARGLAVYFDHAPEQVHVERVRGLAAAAS